MTTVVVVSVFGSENYVDVTQSYVDSTGTLQSHVVATVPPVTQGAPFGGVMQFSIYEGAEFTITERPVAPSVPETQTTAAPPAPTSAQVTAN